MSIQSFKVTWPNDLIPGTDQNKVYPRVLKFRGVEYKTEYEELRDLSILICYLKDNEKELLKFLVIAKFTRGSGESHDQANNILLNGITFSDQPQRIYRYIGHSNSQMRDKEGKNCFLLPFRTDEHVYDFMDRFSDFYSIKTIEKKAKRIAQLFSAFYNYIELSLNECKLIKDVQNVTYIFTDGCGFMSSAFVNKIKDKLRLNYTPSVCQIRYQGFKGVLLHVPQLKEMVHFRDSMHKFRIHDTLSSNLNYFGLLEWSKPYLSRVYLNKQIIMLLESIGVEERILKRLQSEFYDTLENLTIKKLNALEYLSCIGDKKLIDSINENSGINGDTRKSLERMQRDEIDRLTKNSNTEKSRTRILLRNARCVFGVADPYGILKENECFFNPTLLPDDIKTFEKAEKVVVARNPCYYPGDIRVLNLVQKHSLYDHLTDCIVFSVHGKRPIADTMSGGDLDGDKFSVIYDKQLFPKRIHEPFIYKTSDDKQQIYEPNLIHENIIRDSVSTSAKPATASSISTLPPVRTSDRQGLKVNQSEAAKLSIPNKVKLVFPIDLTCSCKTEFTKNMKNLERKLTDHFEQLHCGTSLSYICSTCQKEFEQYVVVSSHYGQCKQETNDLTPAIAPIQKPSSSVSTPLTANSSVLNNSVTNTENNVQKLKLKYETCTAVVEFPINFLCFCKQTFDEKGRNLGKTLAEHFQKTHSSYIFKFTCRGCKRVFDSYLEVSSHYGSCPMKNQIPVNNKPPNDTITTKHQSPAALNSAKKLIEIKSTVTTSMSSAAIKQQQHQVLPLNSLPLSSNPIAASSMVSLNELSFLESKQSEPKTTQKGASNVKQHANTKRALTQNAKVEFRKQLIDYFGKFDTSLVGQLDSLFMNFAAISGPECPECVELNKLLSLAIDMQITKQDAINQIRELQKKYKKIESENNNKTLPEIKFWSDMEKITDEFLKKFKK